MSDTAFSSGWQAIEGLQHYLENNKWLDAASLAAEEALTDVLDAFISGEAVTDAEINRSFHSRRMNRRRRNRQREKLVRKHAHNSIRLELDQRITDAAAEVENVNFLQVLEQKLDACGFNLLRQVADGMGYSQLALGFGMSDAALRTKVCRIRERARSMAA